MTKTNQDKILITGASGFIGEHLMNSLKQDGKDVIGVDLKSDCKDVIKADLSEPETIKNALKDCSIVIHTAAMVSNAMSDEAMWKTNVVNTSNLIKLAIECSVKRFVHISSIVVYGNIAEGEISEKMPVNSTGGNYVHTKILSEHALLQAKLKNDIELVILRPGDVYGPGSRPWIVEPIKAIKNKQFMLPSNGQGFFRPVFIDDLIKGIKLACHAESASGEIINLSCEGYVTTEEYFTHHYQWLGKSKPLVVSTKTALILSIITTFIFKLFGRLNEASPATVHQLSTKSWYSIKKAEKLLGWKPETSLDHGMKISKIWARDQGLL